MSLSSGARHALAEASVWVVSALAMVGGIVYFDDLRGLVGLPGPRNACRKRAIALVAPVACVPAITIPALPLPEASS